LIRIDRARSRSLTALLDRSRAKLYAQAKLLGTLDYHNVLARGFALVRDAEGAMLRRAAEITPSAALDIEFADGHVQAHADPVARTAKPETKARPRRRDDKQGNLL
jgi:exodeoxyribonuclease VII large subunit